MIILKKITEENREEAEKLQVEDFQKGYIESVKECLQEADLLENWNPVGVYDNNIIIGFAMYGNITESKYTRLWFDRLLIDKKYQNKGYGKKSFEIVLERIKQEYKNLDIYLSVYEENKIAINIYKYFGFEFTGELDTKGEKIMKYIK